MNIPEIIGIAAGVCTSSSAVPQVVKTIKEKGRSGIMVYILRVYCR